MTDQLHVHFSFSCIGEGNGSPLQRSCLENPRDVEPVGLPSMGLHRVGHDWSDLAAAAHLHMRGTVLGNGETTINKKPPKFCLQGTYRV